jgi:fructosamine-3-kinase
MTRKDFDLIINKNSLNNLISKNYTLELFTRSLFPIYLLKSNDLNIIIKLIDNKEMAISEQYSLNYLYNLKINSPKIFFLIEHNTKYLLGMEFVDTIPLNKSNLIETLFQLYSNKSKNFGFKINNFIGTLKQPNFETEKFSVFFWKYRFLPMIDLAIKNNYLTINHKDLLEKFHQRVCDKNSLDSFTPRLIHGDFWNGNVINSQNKTYLIDPSLSYGHPEQDFAMSEMFGGFPIGFIDELIQELQLPKDYHLRKNYWSIYPLLVHINIFGTSYISSFESNLAQLQKKY